MIDKIRHGSEISSSKLNEIISAVNKMESDNKEVISLKKELDSRLDSIYNQLEAYSEQVAEHLESLPEVKNLYADILLARDSVDWINIAEDETDVDDFIAAAKIIKKKYPNTEFNMLGFIEPTESHYEAELEKLGKQDIVHYRGSQKDVKPWIK